MIDRQQVNGKTLFFVFNDDGAPECDCGDTAVAKIGYSANGNPYGVFVCAKGAGEDWKSKCEFSQWVERDGERK